MKLLILSDGAVYKQSGEYYSKDTFLLFIQNLSEYFAGITLCIPVSNTPPQREESLSKPFESWNNSRRLKIIEIYPHKTVINFYKKFPLIFVKNLLPLAKSVKDSDIVFLRLPAINGFLVAILALLYNKPIVCYVVGSEENVVETGSKYRSTTKKLALNIARIHSFFYKKILKHSKVVFFLSSELKNEFGSENKNSYLTFTSLVEKKDILLRNNTFQSNGITLLYVGRLSHEKGLDYLIHAVVDLIQDGFKVKLLVCGGGPEKARMEIISGKLGLDSVIEFLGHVPFGEDLDKVYLRSDIFILPSFSEGVPKVLLEAMAKGLPIIATNVGGIPVIIKNEENGILIQPKSSEAIVHAVKRVIEKPKLRKKLIKNGYGFVEEHTAEKQAKRIAEIIYKHLGSSHLEPRRSADD